MTILLSTHSKAMSGPIETESSFQGCFERTFDMKFPDVIFRNLPTDDDSVCVTLLKKMFIVSFQSFMVVLQDHSFFSEASPKATKMVR